MGAKKMAAFENVINEWFTSACCGVSIRADLSSSSILAFTSSQERDPIHLPCAPSRCTQQHATFPETSSASGGVQARVHASWTFHRSRFPAWETQVSDSTPTHTASKDRRLLLFRITAERGEGHVNALGFKYTTRTRRNGCCHRNDSDAARKHPKKLGPAFV